MPYHTTSSPYTATDHLFVTCTSHDKFLSTSIIILLASLRHLAHISPLPSTLYRCLGNHVFTVGTTRCHCKFPHRLTHCLTLRSTSSHCTQRLRFLTVSLSCESRRTIMHCIRLRTTPSLCAASHLFARRALSFFTARRHLAHHIVTLRTTPSLCALRRDLSHFPVILVHHSQCFILHNVFPI